MPKKFKNIPDSAIWKGGVDEGFWIHLFSKDGNIFRFKLYDDFNGALALDGYFEAVGHCEILPKMTDKDLLNAIFVFEDNAILFDTLDCKLMLKPPILDGRMK